jgi:GAF domain-containing protein
MSDDPHGMQRPGEPPGALSDDPDLQNSLHDLAGLVTGSMPLEDLLGRVATFAAHAIPGAEGAGVTLLRVGQPHNLVEAIAATAAFVREIDEIQYRVVQEGPCISAAFHRRTVRSGNLETEQLWPRFGPRAGHLGIHSALSLPLLLPDQVVGAINVYSRGKDVFDETAAALGELFAAPAAVAVRNAQVLSQARLLIEQLERAISNRPVVDQAIGIVRSRTGSSAEDAMERLRALSQSEHVKLTTLAQRIVDQATERARSRRKP